MTHLFWGGSFKASFNTPRLCTYHGPGTQHMPTETGRTAPPPPCRPSRFQSLPLTTQADQQGQKDHPHFQNEILKAQS